MDDRVAESTEDLVPVMVPRNLLSDVYGFIAERSQGAESTNGVLHRGWTAPMIVEAYKVASDRMRAVLDLLASRPGEKLYVDDLMEALGASEPDFVNGVLGAFGRLTNQRFAPRLPDRKNTWPLTVAKDVRDGRPYYEMPPSVADVIKSIDH